MPAWHGYMPPPPPPRGHLNHYRDQARRRDANQRAALALVIEELTVARDRLQGALRRLELRRTKP